MANKPKTKKCVYKECFLPKNNNVYLFQGLFILFGIAGFYLLHNELTFFNIFLFIMPIVLDLLYTDVYGKLAIVKRIYMYINIICGVICIIGITMLTENGLHVSANVIFCKDEINLSIIKKIMLFIISTDVAIPVMFYRGRPCEATKNSVEAFLSIDSKEEAKC